MRRVFLLPVVGSEMKMEAFFHRGVAHHHARIIRYFTEKPSDLFMFITGASVLPRSIMLCSSSFAVQRSVEFGLKQQQ